MSESTAAHATFVIDRVYEAPPARVFAAWADAEAKRTWFGPRDGGAAHELDFRVGGREHFEAGVEGALYRYDAVYEDIREGARIVYTYNMHCNGERMSVSLSTVAFDAQGGGTHLRYTEQGVYLDALDTPQAREHGTREMLEHLAGALGAGAGG